LTGSDDKTAILWDVEDGRKIRVLEGHPSEVNALAFALDGRQAMVAGGGDSQWDNNTKTSKQNPWFAVLWDLQTGRRIRTFDGSNTDKYTHSGSVYYVALARDARLALMASHYGPASLLDVAGGKRAWYLDNLDHQTREPQFSAYGDRLLTLTPARAGTIYDLKTGQKLRIFEILAECASAAAISPDGHTMATKTRGGSDAATQRPVTTSATLWDVETGNTIRTVSGYPDAINVLEFSPDGRNLLIAGGGGSEWDPKTNSNKDVPSFADLCNLETGAKKRLFDGRSNEIAAAVLSPNGRQILTGAPGVAAHLWDIETGRIIQTFGGYSGRILTFSPDGHQVLISAGGWNAKTRQSDPVAAVLFDAEGGQKLRTFKGPPELHAAAFSPDGRLLSLSTWNDAPFLFDVATGETLRNFKFDQQEFMNGLSFDSSGNYVLAIGNWRLLYVWDWATGELVLHGSATADGILYTTPEGFFDGPASASKEVCYRIGKGLNVVPVDRFFQDFYRSGLYSSVLSGNRPIPQARPGKSLPPTVKLLSPEPGDIGTQQTSVEVEITDQGGGVSNLAVFQNGARIIASAESARNGKVTHLTFKIALVQGENQIKITAANGDGSWESEPAEIMLRYEKPLAKSHLFVAAIGINKYADPSLNLTFAANDAQAVADLFRRRGKALYREVDATVLTDEKASKGGIRNTLKDLAARTNPQDTLLLFLAGHGTMIGQRYYFMPSDLHKEAASLEDDVRKQGLPADEISEYLGAAKALKRILIFDTCASGGALASATKSRSGFELRGAIERLSRSQGIFTIAASAASEQAQESKELGHGVLTYSLLAGLKAVDSGPLAGKNIQPGGSDRVVDIMEWFSYASGNVPRLTENVQDVQTSTQGSSFPLLPLEE
jgi:WD40 repeat protein